MSKHLSFESPRGRQAPPVGAVVSVPGAPDAAEGAWVAFPGGELEGRPPRTLCPVCRAALRQHGIRQRRPKAGRQSRTLCFACYRADLARQRARAAAGALDTASVQRFQALLPFEPVDRARLERLRSERATARVELQSGRGRFTDRRRRAQIAARHALQRLAAGLQTRDDGAAAERERRWAAALHAAELQLPASWMPFVAGDRAGC
jgi:hypothetical protein